MKKYIRIVSLIFAFAMLLSVFASCAVTNDPETTTEAPDEGSTVGGGQEGTESDAASTDKDGYILPTLPEDLQYNNETVSILYWEDVERVEFDIAFEDTSDMVEEAVYTRNMTAQDRLGVVFEWTGQLGNNKNRTGFANYVENCYSSGQYYDIIATYSRTSAMLCFDGYLEDINSIEENYLDLEMPWWPESMVETCSIDDALYFVSGDISTNILHFMYAIYYNIDMLTDLKLEDPIAKVDNKTWTLDALIDYTKELYQDTDQSGTATEGDTYGFCSSYFHLDAFYSGSGLKLVEDDPDGIIKVSDDFWSQKSVDLVDRLVAWFKSGDTIVNTYSGSLKYDTPFEEGRALFCQNRVYMADTKYHSGALRNVEWDYGILPTPLYNEDQEDYITLLGNPITLWSIMKGAKSPSMSSAVLECLASEAYRKTSPALFENNMKYRYTPDAAGKGDGARMFDVISENISFDLGRIFSDSLLYMSELPSRAAADKQSWAAILPSKRVSLSRKADELNAALAEILDS